MEQLIALETAKLAKEKGFDLYSQGYYGCDEPSGDTVKSNQFVINSWCKSIDIGEKQPQEGTAIYSAPSQSMLQTWLRERGILVWCIPSNIDEPKWRTNFIDDIVWYDTYEEALEQAILLGLNKIKS